MKRHKTFFLVLVSNPFFWIGYTFYLIFGFWLSVRNGFLYFVFGFSFFIFYFNFILANRLASPFLFGPLFFILVSPVYSVNKDQLYFYLSSIRYCYCSCFKSSSLSRRLRSSSVDCSYLQNVLEL